MFETLKRLKGLLTNTNLDYLDVILGSLLDSHHPAFITFWAAFKQRWPEGDKHYQAAYRGLAELRSILQDYRSKG